MVRLSCYQTIIKLIIPNSCLVEYLSNFLIGEGKLERYLEEFSPVEANVHRAKIGLIEAKRFLQLAANDNGKKVNNASILIIYKIRSI